MDCKDFERLIPDFISDRLKYQDLKSFCEHMEYCEDCKEELVIQFLVTEGIQRLEGGNAFDLQGELKERLKEALVKVRRHTFFLRIGLALEVAAVGVLIGCILWVLV